MIGCYILYSEKLDRFYSGTTQPEMILKLQGL